MMVVDQVCIAVLQQSPSGMRLEICRSMCVLLLITTYQQNAEQCNNFFLFAGLQRQQEEVFSGDLQYAPEFSSHPGSLAA